MERGDRQWKGIGVNSRRMWEWAGIAGATRLVFWTGNVEERLMRVGGGDGRLWLGGGGLAVRWGDRGVGGDGQGKGLSE